MFTEIFIPFLVVGLAEIGDKTQVSVLLLASKTKQHFTLLWGVMAAFFIVDGIAILAGSWITDFIPLAYLKLASALFFIGMGIIMLINKDESSKNRLILQQPLYAGFMLVFLSEWGDKTQLMSAVLALQYPPIFVFIGVMVALFVLSLLSIYLGNLIVSRFSEKNISRFAGSLFIVLGMWSLLAIF